MSFNLRIVFTGVCAFVRNADESKKAKMCVVLPNGTGRKLLREEESADGKSLRRHRGFLQFKVSQLGALASNQEPLPPDADAIWYLDRHRLTFLTSPTDRKREPFPLVDTGISSIAKLDLIVPKFSELDRAALGENPPNTVLAQVLLYEGVLTTNPQLRQWVFPPTLSGRVLNPNLSHEVILSIPGLDQVDVIASPFDGRPATRWAIAGPDGSEVTITIANLCDDNPLRWETDERDRNPDEDFRWYYRLLAPAAQQDLSSDMRGLPFPVPQPIPDNGGNAQGMNCIPMQTKASEFDLDRYLPTGFVLTAKG